jgi:hypothetical protein
MGREMLNTILKALRIMLAHPRQRRKQWVNTCTSTAAHLVPASNAFMAALHVPPHIPDNLGFNHQQQRVLV